MALFSGILSQSLRLAMRTTPVASASRLYSTEEPEFTIGEGGLTTWKLPLSASHKCEPPPTEVTVSKEEFLGMYRDMLRIRRMETLCDVLYKQREIKGFLHLYSGQEAVAVGIENAITKDDGVITAYRCHGFQLLRGDTMDSVIAETCGRSTGCSKGKGGSMHMYYKNFYGGNGIVGAHVPVGAGVAFANKYLENGNICVAAYGDGAANQGQLFEAYNMAALWKLPLVFVVENNMYAMGTSVSRSYAGNVYYTRGDFVPGFVVDGMNVLAVKNAMQYAADWARSGNGPLILEMKTYRYSGHSLSDPGTSYRSRDEVKNVRETSDPIQAARSRLLAAELATEEELKAIEKEAKEEANAAHKKALADPFPEPEDLYKDILVEDTFVRGVELAKSHYPKN
mmetsp:Transcript_25238/g.39387  ORF Transcript_25238/g.39387 Transcript_25238/m.39387 type:complete len:397 (-) Transcript_25238:29-1219(-)|eukprot:CAMPEP_0201517766 /NCGR_PEP_ID=MMETSP0161_2-20130828/8801_1 /ASSEMBLY_ACC=CAM_ASM_000251 /TAXON_ID=180227 /ORGANISM="Neoparamoeba aestuarina, Strain SoJaBio B1-5/56/2" /LENGTH=396 /DNA_ID=CAMNT_0047915377 /DNA_START=90 /DNA_END=1280 /DNA_ORIENTATION=-